MLKTENNNALRKFDIFNSSIEVPYIEKVSADVLKVEEITYENILKDINFDVKVGDVIGLVGKNGVGKTTLLRILMKIIRPTKGKIIENKKKFVIAVFSNARNGLPIFHRISEERVSPGE